jgi:hypothetical protein
MVDATENTSTLMGAKHPIHPKKSVIEKKLLNKPKFVSEPKMTRYCTFIKLFRDEIIFYYILGKKDKIGNPHVHVLSFLPCQYHCQYIIMHHILRVTLIIFDKALEVEAVALAVRRGPIINGASTGQWAHKYTARTPASHEGSTARANKKKRTRNELAEWLVYLIN